MKRLFIFAGMLTVLLLGLSASLSPASAISGNDLFYLDPIRNYAEGEIEPYYVRYQPGSKNAMAQAARALGGEVVYDLDIVDTLAVNVPPQAIQGLSKSPHLVFYEPVPQHSLLETAVTYLPNNVAPTSSRNPEVVPWNIDQYQARDIWDIDRNGIVDPGAPTGAGVKFCIIDTGLYGYHEDFDWSKITGFSQITGEAWYEDENGHGTHVAGTANAVQNGIGVVGVAPGGMELHIVKIFNNQGTWSTGQSNLGTAAQNCRDNGANVLSMSLGGGYSATEESIFQALYDDNNILNIAAAGNAGNTTKSYPASYDSVVSVAALDQDEAVAEFSQYPTTSYNPNSPPANVEWDVVELSGGGVNVLSAWPGPPGGWNGDVPVFLVIDNDNTHYDRVNAIEESANGDVTQTLVSGGLCDATNGAWSGRIVLCERGSVSFADKVNNVRNSGGLAAIIYNNVAGEFGGTCAGTCTQPSIPALSMSQADGQYLLNNKLNTTVRLISDDGSGCATCNGSYYAISGTSMATPGVAAAVGFTWAACGGGDNPNVTNKDIRQLLRDTAKDLTGVHASGGAYGAGWDRMTGWGLVQLKDALDLGTERFGASNCPPVGQVQINPAERNVCTLNATSATFAIEVLRGDYTGNYAMSLLGLPIGANYSYTPNPIVNPDNSATLTVSDLQNGAAGSHSLTIVATDPSDPSNEGQGSAILNLAHDLAAGHTPLTPANGSAAVSLRPTFSWSAADIAASYILEVATDSGFSNVVINETVSGTSYTPASDLAADTIYYWRVTAVNICGGSASAAFVFYTPACNVYTGAASGAIANGGGTATLGAAVALEGTVTEVNVLNVAGRHNQSVSNFRLTLRNPGASVARIIKQSGACGTAQDFGPVAFSDGAGAACPPLSGTIEPHETLAAFNGVAANGNWTLFVENTASGGGQPGSRNLTINSWSVEVCVESTTATQLVELQAGWNIISSHALPHATNMADVMATIADDVMLVKNGAGQFYVPGVFNGIGNWQWGEGYLVQMAAPRTLVIAGEAIPETSPISLGVGWRAITYLPAAPMDAAVALASINGSFDLVKNSAGQFYVPGVFNGIGSLVPGQGYLIQMNQANTLIYPAND